MMAVENKFVFVNYTGQPDVEAKQSLPTVRQHVMHDFFRRQREADHGTSDVVDAAPPSTTTIPSHASGVSAVNKPKPNPRRRPNPHQATSQPRTKRASTNIRKASQARTKNPSRQSSSESVLQHEYPVIEEIVEDKSISSDRTPSLTDTSSSYFPEYNDFDSPSFSCINSGTSPDLEVTSPLSTALVPQQNTLSEAPALYQPNPFLLSPAVHRWDPFNSMPLNGLAVDNLATWHFHRPINRNNIWESKVGWLDKVDSVFRRSLWKLALTSTPLFHILLCISEMKRSVLTGDRNQINYFEHKIAAMRAISEGVSRLSTLPQFSGLSTDEVAGLTEGSTETFIMLVAIQVNLALGDKEYDAARTHMRYVGDMAAKAGGIHTFGYTQWRHTIWNDLKLASACLERPMLPYSPRYQHALMPPDVRSAAHRLALESVRLIPISADLTSEMAYDLFNRLHQMALAFDTQLTDEDHFYAFENMIYQTVYQLSSTIAESSSHAECSVTDMLILGAKLSTWMCMPSLVNLRAIFSTVINTVQSKLVYRLWNGLKSDLIASWESVAKLESLLWVLFQACLAAISVCSSSESWMPQYMVDSFVSTISQVAMRLQITNAYQFETILRSFPFSENVFGDDCKFLWNRMGLGDDMMSPDMVSPTAMIIEQI